MPSNIKAELPKDAYNKIDAAERSGKEFLSIDCHGSTELVSRICELTHLTRLDLYNVTELPLYISNLRQLKHLEIQASPGLIQLPNESLELHSLRYLRIKNTSLKSIPRKFFSMPQLTTLYLWGNYELDDIPNEVANLKSLEFLSLSGNRPYDGITKGRPLLLPSTLGHLPNLKTLQLDTNNLEDLPTSVSLLSGLEELSISFNFFTRIPEPVFELRSLKRLNIEGIHLKELPNQLGALSNLQELNADVRFVANVPDYVLEAGPKALIRFLAEGQIPQRRQNHYKENSTSDMATTERYRSYFESVNDEYDGQLGDHFSELQDYVLNGSAEVPYPNEDLYYDVKKLPEQLSPFREWTAIDLRVLTYITQDTWCFDDDFEGFYRNFYRWLCRELVANYNDTYLFEEVLRTLHEHGLDEKAKLPQRQTELSDGVMAGSIPTSLGQFLLNGGEKVLSPLVSHGINRQFLVPFARHNFPILIPHLDQLTRVDTYQGDDGKQHIHYGNLQVLATYNANAVEEIISSRINEVDCVGCKCSLAKLLLDTYGEKYYDTASTIAKETIEYVNKRKKSPSYIFIWPAISIAEDSTDQLKEWAKQTFNF